LRGTGGTGGPRGIPTRPPLRMGPAEDSERGPVGTLGRSGMVCLIGGRWRARLIWSITRDG